MKNNRRLPCLQCLHLHHVATATPQQQNCHFEQPNSKLFFSPETKKTTTTTNQPLGFIKIYSIICPFIASMMKKALLHNCWPKVAWFAIGTQTQHLLHFEGYWVQGWTALEQYLYCGEELALHSPSFWKEHIAIGTFNDCNNNTTCTNKAN